MILRTGQRATSTKDLDLYAYPVEDVMGLWDELEAAVEGLGGRIRWEPDGASITAHVPVAGREIPVEFVLGREDFIQPEVLEDAVETADERDQVLVPSWEHIVTMKAEAWFDRTGRERETYLADLRTIRAWMDEEATEAETSGEPETGGRETGLDREEVRRLVDLRPERKRREMMLALGRVFEGRMG